jgi:hypothetical protein
VPIRAKENEARESVHRDPEPSQLGQKLRSVEANEPRAPERPLDVHRGERRFHGVARLAVFDDEPKDEALLGACGHDPFAVDLIVEGRDVGAHIDEDDAANLRFAD